MPPKTRASGATPQRGRTSATPSPAQPVPPSASSPSGGIARTPSGRFRASVDAKTVGTFDTLEEAAAAITHATMLETTGADHSPAAARPGETIARQRRTPKPAPPTPERAAKSPLPGDPAPPKAKPSASDRRPTFARLVLLPILTLVLALVAAWGLEASTRSSAPEAAPVRSCASLASDAALAELAPAGWDEPLRAFVDAAREASDASNAAVRFSGAAKGPAALLATNGDATSYSAAAAKVAAAFGACVADGCALIVDCAALGGGIARGDGGARSEARSETSLDDIRGEAQRLLFDFLDRCPGGVVTFASAEALAPPTLAATLPAVSEGGRFHRDGRAVLADRAAYVFVANLGQDAEVREGEDEGRYARRAKDALAARWRRRSGGGEGGEEEDADVLVAAFARRIDFVAPASGW